MDIGGKISVIIPIYNSEKYLESCLNSVLNQTYRNLEVILINDGSTDNSDLICQKIADADARVIVVNQKNQGPGAARNTGLSKVTGDYLTFVDSDDCLANKYVYSILINEIESQNVQAVFFSSQILDCEGKVIRTYFAGNNIVERTEEIIKGIIKDNVIYGGGYPWNKIWKVNKENICRFDKDLYAFEDKKWCLEQLLLCDRIFLSSNVCYNYYVRENSLVHDKRKEESRLINGLIAYRRIYNIFINNQLYSHVVKDKYADLVMITIWRALKSKYKRLLNMFIGEYVNQINYLKLENRYNFKEFIKSCIVRIYTKLFV